MAIIINLLVSGLMAWIAYVVVEELNKRDARLELNPVVHACLAFIFGIMPLIRAIGPGCNSRKSLGVIVLGGMVAAVIIGTLLVPSFYAIIQKLREDSSRKKCHNKVEGEEN